MLCLALAGFSMSAMAGDMSHMERHQSMDTNKDGLVSKAEFTSHHEKMWNDMKKTSAGVVDLKSMPMGDKMNCGSDMKEKAKS